MPELPEVETTRRGIEPHLLGHTVSDVTVRQPQLRWPIPDDLAEQIEGRSVERVERRAKYLLIGFANGTLIIHLGMSGSLRMVPAGEEPAKHDHVDIRLDSGWILRYHDPRRFGCMLWDTGDVSAHKLLVSLGPEPLTDAFDGERLYRLSRKRRVAVKSFIMDNAVVVGVGNIYANEALFFSGIRPTREAGQISKARYLALADEIKRVLARAIEQGGTTLRDFVGGDGKPGYFKQQLQVYGRAGEPCRVCETPIKEKVIGQRNTFFCSDCQR